MWHFSVDSINQIVGCFDLHPLSPDTDRSELLQELRSMPIAMLRGVRTDMRRDTFC